MSGRQRKEMLIRGCLAFVALVSLLTLSFIVLFLVREGLPIFHAVSLHDFMLGEEWYPTDTPPAFGIWPLFLGSVLVTLCSSLLAVPFGLFTAIYIAELAPKTVKGILKWAIELLASLPSVVLGFMAMVVLAPWLQETFDLPTGLNILNASIVLALMAIPTISSMAEDAIYAVPREYKDASYALGATRYETLVKVVIPAALSGISTAVILGMSRAMGETMVVLMAAGGAAAIPHSIFDSVRPMTATIAAEMGESPFHSMHYHALYALGIVLFLITLVFNLVADYPLS